MIEETLKIDRPYDRDRNRDRDNRRLSRNGRDRGLGNKDRSISRHKLHREGVIAVEPENFIREYKKKKRNQGKQGGKHKCST